MKDTRDLFGDNLVHVWDHKAQTLRGCINSNARSRFQSTMYHRNGSRSSGDLGNLPDFSEKIGFFFASPISYILTEIGLLCHWVYKGSVREGIPYILSYGVAIKDFGVYFNFFRLIFVLRMAFFPHSFQKFRKLK
eukprot:Lithocolla_globosa_v1_NODE_454_length_4000_cov_50.809886.p2 type:complete len:135 gc:universal NODE_454_length_4000_cov_50.809886:1035-631(-)